MPYTHIGTMPTRATVRSYQPLRAGQFKGYGGCNVIPSRTTIVNNNYYNMGIGMGSYNAYGWNNNGCCQDDDMSKGAKWMIGIGAGTSLLGVLLNAFGIGNKKGVEDGQGGTEEKPQDNGLQAQLDTANKKIAELEKQLGGLAKPQTAAAPAETRAAQAAPEAEAAKEKEEAPKTDYSKTIANGLKMTCTDAKGNTSDIVGTLSNVQTDANGVPQSFTLTDDTSGNKYNYQVRIADDGSITYECVSKNGQATIGAPNYTLENGKLVNKEGQNGYGIGIQTKAANANPTAGTKAETKPTKDDEQKIANAKTLVSKAFPNASKNVTVGFKNGEVTYTYNNKEFTNFLELGREIDPNYAKGTSAQQTRNNADFWKRQAGYGM